MYSGASSGQFNPPQQAQGYPQTTQAQYAQTQPQYAGQGQRQGQGQGQGPPVVMAEAVGVGVPHAHNVQAARPHQMPASGGVCRDCRSPYEIRLGESDCSAEYFRCPRCKQGLKSNYFELGVFRDTCSIQ